MGGTADERAETGARGRKERPSNIRIKITCPPARSASYRTQWIADKTLHYLLLIDRPSSPPPLADFCNPEGGEFLED